MSYKHVPVMIEEVISFLAPKKGDFVVDCTLGGASYTIEISKLIGESGRVLSFDLDRMAIDNAKVLIKEKKLQNIELINDNYKNLGDNLFEMFGERENQLDGIVMDLGMSSAQLDDKNRGISFLNDSPLDMAFGESDYGTVDIVNNWKAFQLKKILREYGEEKFADNIVRNIVKERKKDRIDTTKKLVKIIEESIPKRYLSKKIHPATKTFQALRIATNDEIGSLEKVLPQAIDSLKKGGRLVVVSFHSLEDRVVKNFFRESARDCVCPKNAPVCVCEHKAKLKIITKKIVVASDEEVKNNPRSRSAKLRVAERI